LVDDSNAASSGEDPENIEVFSMSIPGFASLEMLHPTSEEHLYTLVGTTTAGVRKRLRFAPGTQGRARLRLRHELDVLRILQEQVVETVPQPDSVEYFPDRGICSIYAVMKTRSFHEFGDHIAQMDWSARLGCILKLAQSLAMTLSHTHMAGIFRIGSIFIAEA
jgi:hypothetical protein